MWTKCRKTPRTTKYPCSESRKTTRWTTTQLAGFCLFGKTLLSRVGPSVRRGRTSSVTLVEAPLGFGGWTESGRFTYSVTWRFAFVLCERVPREGRHRRRTPVRLTFPTFPGYCEIPVFPVYPTNRAELVSDHIISPGVIFLRDTPMGWPQGFEPWTLASSTFMVHCHFLSFA